MSKVKEPKKLTNKIIKNALPGDNISDAACPGLSLRVTPKGKKVFSWRGRVQGRQKRIQIGEWSDVLTLEQARRRARELSTVKDAGRDPHEERREARLAAVEKAEKAQTLRQVAVLYLAERKQEVRHGSWRNIESRLRLHVLPTFGGLRPEEIRKSVVRRWRTQVASERSTDVANAATVHLRALINFAIEMEFFRGPNPTEGIRKFPSSGRERFLSDTERGRLESVLKNYEGDHPGKVAAIRLLSLTGCRKEEICGLRWDEVHLDLGLLRLTDERSKTGKKDVPLTPQAVAYLRELQDAREKIVPWVCPNRRGRPQGNYLGDFWRTRLRVDPPCPQGEIPLLRERARELHNVGPRHLPPRRRWGWVQGVQDPLPAAWPWDKSFVETESASPLR